MVRVVRQEHSDDERLDGLVARLADKHGLKLDRTGWARKTYDLFVADECFLSGTGAEIVPVVALDGRAIGGGTPGAVTRRLAAAFHALAEREGTPVF